MNDFFKALALGINVGIDTFHAARANAEAAALERLKEMAAQLRENARAARAGTAAGPAPAPSPS